MIAVFAQLTGRCLSASLAFAFCCWAEFQGRLSIIFPTLNPLMHALPKIQVLAPGSWVMGFQVTGNGLPLRRNSTGDERAVQARAWAFSRQPGGIHSGPSKPGLNPQHGTKCQMLAQPQTSLASVPSVHVGNVLSHTDHTDSSNCRCAKKPFQRYLRFTRDQQTECACKNYPHHNTDSTQRVIVESAELISERHSALAPVGWPAVLVLVLRPGCAVEGRARLRVLSSGVAGRAWEGPALAGRGTITLRETCIRAKATTPIPTCNEI